MKRYRERGGWFSLALAFASAASPIFVDGISHPIIALTILGFVILCKVERISNALSDLHNDREV